jgi:hypothetical protein
MHHPNHAMVNAANALMSEYGDAMQNAIYNTAPQKPQIALANTFKNMDGKGKYICIGLGVLGALYLIKSREQAVPTTADAEFLGRF